MKEDMRPIPARVTFPKEGDIVKLMHLILKSKKPVLIIGSQAVLAPIHVNELMNAVKVCSTYSFIAFKLIRYRGF